MQQSSRGWRVSFQTKVLVPVILILILLVGIMIGTLNQRITNQLQTEAAHELATADSVFQNSQIIRAKNLLLLYRNVPNDPRFKAVSQKGDGETLRFLLSELIDELGGDIALSVNREGQGLASASKDSRLKLADFEPPTADRVQQIPVRNEHFLGLSGYFPSLNPEDQSSSPLPSSSGRPLRVLHATQRLRAGVSLLASLGPASSRWVACNTRRGCS